jgi:hypothetical protein
VGAVVHEFPNWVLTFKWLLFIILSGMMGCTSWNQSSQPRPPYVPQVSASASDLNDLSNRIDTLSRTTGELEALRAELRSLEGNVQDMKTKLDKIHICRQTRDIAISIYPCPGGDS